MRLLYGLPGSTASTRVPSARERRRTLVVRRIQRLDVTIGNPDVFNGTISQGQRLSAYGRIIYDDSLGGSGGTSDDAVDLTIFTSSNPSVVKWNHLITTCFPDGSVLSGYSEVEGVSAGTASVFATYRGFVSPSVSLRVVP